MKAGFFVICALLIGAVAAHFLLENNGYVLINFRDYTVEMSVPILIFVAFLLYLATRFIVRLLQAPRELGEMAARARARRTNNQITRGIAALAEGKLARGEKLLTKGARHSDAPMLNYLTAARAAQAQGDTERRDGWLKMAYEHGGEAENAVLLTQTELQLANGELNDARQSLEKIRANQPDHPQALKLAAELAHRDEDWNSLSDLMPALRKAKNISAHRLDDWTAEAFDAQISGSGIDNASIEAYWKRLPRHLRKESRLISSRSRALIACGNSEKAASELRKAIKKSWDDELLELYGSIKAKDSNSQLKQIESWLNTQPENPIALLAAGRACLRNELWGKARSYIESSVAIKPTPAAYHELGQLMLKMDDNAAATAAFAKGLTLSGAGVPDLPRLAADKADEAESDPEAKSDSDA